MDNGDQMILKCLREILTVFLWPVMLYNPRWWDAGNQKPKHLFSKWIGIHLEQESDKIRHDAIRYSSSMNFK